jgi:hypothetical protein
MSKKRNFFKYTIDNSMNILVLFLFLVLFTAIGYIIGCSCMATKPNDEDEDNNEHSRSSLYGVIGGFIIGVITVCVYCKANRRADNFNFSYIPATTKI